MNDKITIQCPACNAKLAVASQHAGKKLKCPRCKTFVHVPTRMTNDADDDGNLSFLVDDGLPPIQLAQTQTNGNTANGDDDEDDPVRCPECDSRQIHAEKRGWNFWFGLIGSGTIVLTCLKCGHKFYPGDE